MWKTLVAKEMRAHLLSFRLLWRIVILFVLVTATAVVLTGEYVRKLDDIPGARRSSTAYLRPATPTSTHRNVLQPTQAAILSDAHPRLSADVNMALRRRSPPGHVPLIDLTFIVTIP